jgi:drug/metabolite transporter (DMT)-like permease
MEIVLALAAAVFWGVADFGSGMKSRSVSAVVVTLVVFVVGGTLSLVLAVATETAPDGRTLAFAVLAGAVTGLGVTLFFRALAIGEIGVVAPIVAAGTAVPVVAGLAGGERPSIVAATGVALVIAGVVAMVRVPSSGATSAPAPGRAVKLSVIASIALGLYYVVGREGGADTPLWYAGLGQLFAAVPLLAITLVRRGVRPGRRHLTAIVALGAANGAGWVCSVLALRHGLLSLVSVLVALYPALTVLLALVFAGERLTRLQYAAAGTILGGVGLVAAG